MSPDLESCAAVANYCRLTFGGLQTVNNGWIALHHDGRPPAVSYSMRRAAVRTLRAQGFTVRHPDVMVCDMEAGSPKRVAVIEVDGSVHEAKSERTHRRNMDYGAHDVPLLVLTDGAVSLGDGWKEEVDAFVSDAFPEVLA